MSEGSEEQIAALQQRIRSAAVENAVVRWCVFISLGWLLSGFLLLVVAPLLRLPMWTAAPSSWLLLPTMAIPIAGSVAVAHRQAKSRRLVSHLREMAPAQRLAVLLPLEAAPLADTRRMAGSLLRQLSATSELSPSDAPAGRGDEPTP